GSAGVATLHQEDLGLLAGFEGAARVVLVGLALGPRERRPRWGCHGMHEKALLKSGSGVMESRPIRIANESQSEAGGVTPRGREGQQCRSALLVPRLVCARGCELLRGLCALEA